MANMRDIDLYTKEYDGLPFENIQVEFRRKKVLEQISKYKHDHILEVGCGLEPLFAYFYDFSAMTIVEPSSEFVNRAQKILDEEYVERDCSVEIIQGFFEEESKKICKKQYDMIVISSLLHEVENPDKVLNVAYKLCAENTVVHINVPNAKSLHRYLAVEMGLIDNLYEKSEQQIKLKQHATFDLESLVRLIEECGFSVVEKGSYFPKLFTHKQMQKMIDDKIVNEAMLEGMYKMSKYLGEYGSEIFVDVVKKGV